MTGVQTCALPICSFGCEALVKDRTAFARKYPMLLVERTTLEDIMLFVGKGEVK